MPVTTGAFPATTAAEADPSPAQASIAAMISEEVILMMGLELLPSDFLLPAQREFFRIEFI
jgi:hypothetical protein